MTVVAVGKPISTYCRTHASLTVSHDSHWASVQLEAMVAVVAAEEVGSIHVLQDKCQGNNSSTTTVTVTKQVSETVIVVVVEAIPDVHTLQGHSHSDSSEQTQ